MAIVNEKGFIIKRWTKDEDIWGNKSNDIFEVKPAEKNFGAISLNKVRFSKTHIGKKYRFKAIEVTK